MSSPNPIKLLFAILLALTAAMAPATASAEGAVMNWTVDGVKREALVANIGFAAAGAAAIAAGLLFAFAGGEVVTVAPTSGGATVGVAGAF